MGCCNYSYVYQIILVTATCVLLCYDVTAIKVSSRQTNYLAQQTGLLAKADYSPTLISSIIMSAAGLPERAHNVVSVIFSSTPINFTLDSIQRAQKTTAMFFLVTDVIYTLNGKIYWRQKLLRSFTIKCYQHKKLVFLSGKTRSFNARVNTV